MQLETPSQLSQPTGHPPNPDLFTFPPTSDSENLQRLQHCEALETKITTLAGHINAAEYRFSMLLAEFHEKRGWQGEGIRSLAHWLNWRCGMSLMMAREKVRVARSLGNLPQIETAFRKGEISYSKVRAMTRVATPENEALLLQVAQNGTASHIEKLVRRYRGYRQSSKPMEGEEDLSWRAEKKLNWRHDEDGSLVFSGRLPAEEGAVVVKAIEKIMDDLYKGQIEKKQQQMQEEFHAVDADKENVSAETISENTPASTLADNQPIPDYTQRSANALVRMSEAVLSCEVPLNGSGTGTRHHLLIHINENAAHPDFRINGGALHFLDTLDQQHFLEPEVIRRLACDTAVTTIIEDDQGHPLNVGRKTRIIPPAIQRALHVRDGGCCYPGCCQHRWTEAHHLEHWVDGGETRLDNLVTLCRYHHTCLHQGDYRIVVAADTDVEKQGMLFVLPNNQVMPSAHHPQFDSAQHSLALLEKEHDRIGLDIDKSTADCRWSGETIDYCQTLAGLCEMDQMLT